MSFYTEIKNNNIVDGLKAEIDQGLYFINLEDGKLWNTGEWEISKNIVSTNSLPDVPWIYTNVPSDMHCKWRQSCVNCLGFIHSYCLDCWKVTVKVNTLEELFKLYNMQLEMVADDPHCYCKCGTEERPFVFGNYGGYFYNRSYEEGLEKYKLVREKVNEHIGEHINVIYKRYCTEFELKFGPSNNYHQPERAAKWEEVIDRDCHMHPFPFTQPEISLTRQKHRWIKHAWSIGDETVYKYTDGQPLSNAYMVYHLMEFPITNPASYRNVDKDGNISPLKIDFNDLTNQSNRSTEEPT